MWRRRMRSLHRHGVKIQSKTEQILLNGNRHLAINACLAPVCSMHGLAVTTVEGIGSTKTKLHPVQERIAKAHGSQCGFCTPGIVMSMYALLRNSPKPSLKDLETTFQGNLCRCTGYRPILDGFKTFTEDWEVLQNGNLTTNGVCSMGDQCCKLQNGCSEEKETLFDSSEFIPYDPTQEPIFPPELKLNDSLDRQFLTFTSTDVTWFRPTKLQDVLELKSKHPDAKLVVGNTEVGIEVKFKNCVYPVRIYPVLVEEMGTVSITENGVRIGASVTLEKMTNFLKEQIETLPSYKTRMFTSIIKMLHWFAGRQIRNVASIGGNIMTGSPISDLNQIFIAGKVELELQSKLNGSRRIVMDEHFFVSYRENIVRKDEVLIAIYIPCTVEDQYFYSYKQARRRDDDTAIVNSAINVTFKPKSNIVSDIKIAFGGMGPTTIVPMRTCQAVINQSWNEETLNLMYSCLIDDLPLPPDAPGGMTQYRRSLTLSFVYKAFLEISQELQSYVSIKPINPKDLSALTEFSNKIPKGAQYYEILATNEKHQFVGRPTPHLSTFKHATGEAVYCDDIPPFKNELYMTMVISKRAHAKFTIDPTDALNMEGVRMFISAQDIPKDKNYLTDQNSEVFFASDVIECQGQPLGAIIADNQVIAQQAAKMVKVVYEDLQPIIVSVEDAIKHHSYFDEPYHIEDGNFDEILATNPYVVEGSMKNGGQEHFYLETQSVLAVPKNEDGEMEIHCCTQHPVKISKSVASILDVSENKIITKVRRLGGAFGGKEFANGFVSVPAAIAASKLGRPVRCCQVDFYINAGYVNGISFGVLIECMLKFLNVYKVPNVRVTGRVCKTNLPSNTAFRAFGAPQGILSMEQIVRDVAEYLNKDYLEVARLNFYKEGDLTHIRHKLENVTIERCWSECLKSSNFYERRKVIRCFNRDNRWKKRGITMTPLMYGMAFSEQYLNQASAMLHVYTDGSVLLTHGGVEMGQGLHTKMVQIAAQTLQISSNKIYINETSTDKIPNAVQTAASFSADLYGPAVVNACNIINERLDQYKKSNPKGTWEDWIMKAYFDRVSLSATGFYKYDIEGYNIRTNTGTASAYYSTGAICAEVEIDCLTGDHQVIRTDIVMDFESRVDIGQIEGGFMQGYGFYMLEEIMFTPDGVMLTKGPGTYKLPGFGNVPLEFNVTLLKGAPNSKSIYSSKGIGEPPVCLASCIYFATREAIIAARQDNGLDHKNLKLDAPLTSAKIRMACEDHITANVNLNFLMLTRINLGMCLSESFEMDVMRRL
ncbi:hypothetical protein FQR65_LT03425 [Abscondita terminalis]|nr:hypothetical protein FQR65_LT03425 [Abscondita terminalis]